MTEHVGQVAYQLRHLEGTKIHDVFDVGIHKSFQDDPYDSTPGATGAQMAN